MDKSKKTFDIIRFTPQGKRYYPASIAKQSWMDKSYVKHTKIDIPLGQSRFGGPIVDLPDGIKYPSKFYFAAQLDLAKFSPFDKNNLLPKKGQLLFFANMMTQKVKVIYSDVPNKKLSPHCSRTRKYFF